MRGSAYSAIIEARQIVVSGRGGARPIRIRWVGARSGTTIGAQGRLAGVSNYVLGDQPDEWRLGVPHYRKVVARGVYPGVDVVYYDQGGRLEFDFVVAPGADASLVRFEIVNGNDVEVDAAGDLVMHEPGGAFRLLRPKVYQDVDGERRTIAARYVPARSSSAAATTYAFELASYDTDRPLVIDPILAYARRFGGDALDDVTGVAVDADGNVYLTGYTQSLDFSSPEGEDTVDFGDRGGSDAYALKLSADGSTVLYSTILGGDRPDRSLGIVVDEENNAYLAGTTSFVDSGFPTTEGAYRAAPADFFIAKLGPDGNLEYSTFVGGLNIASFGGLALHGSGESARVAIVGSTVAGFPTTANAFRRGISGPSDTFLFVLEPAGGAPAEQLIYSTYFGSDSFDSGIAVASGPDGKFCVTGTAQGDLPLRHAFDTSREGNREAFLAVFDLGRSGDDSLVYSSYVGGSRDENGAAGDGGVAVDASGVVLVAGTTTSTDFPVTPEGYRVSRESADAFLVAIDPTLPGGDSLVYGTYFGGLGADAGTAVAAGPPGIAYLAGFTSSAELPGRGGDPAEKFGAGARGTGQDAFVAKIDWRRLASDSLIDAAYVGGGGADFARWVVAHDIDTVFLAGDTSSGDAFEPTPGFGQKDGFVARVHTRVQLPDGVVGVSSSDDLELDFGEAPYEWTVMSGDVPEGLVVSGDGVLSGEPETLGDFTFTVEGRDAAGTTRAVTYGKRVGDGATPGDVLIRKAAAIPVPGRTFPYYILLRNRTDRTLYNVGVVEILEFFFQFVSATPAPTLIEPPPTGNVYWTIPEMRPGELKAITYRVRLPDDFPVGIELSGEACLTEEDCGKEKAECFKMGKERCENAGCVGPGSVGSCNLCNKQEGEFCQSEWLRCIALVGKGSSQALEEGSFGGGCWTKRRRTQRPVDPNQKGVASEPFVRSGEILAYTIEFENIGDIEAQDVFLTDALDEDLDLATLRVLRPYGGLVPLLPDVPVSIFEDDDERWIVTLDGETRVVTWDLLGIDLPAGESDSVLLVVQAPEGLPSGTELVNEATIQFEVFETLTTNATVNTIDDIPPVATIEPLPEITTSPSFEISWSGTDQVGEIEIYAIFASTNGGPYVQIERAFEPGTALFEGEFGSTYSFLAIARDTAGNVEELDDVAEATTILRRPGAAVFHRGDPNASDSVDISDGIFIFEFLFSANAPTLNCREAADSNNDGSIDISDGLYLLNWLFADGAELPAPGPASAPCGPDPDPPGSPGDLGCDDYGPCQ